MQLFFKIYVIEPHLAYLSIRSQVYLFHTFCITPMAPVITNNIIKS